MSENVELSSLNLRYEDHRQRDAAREARLLASLAERGIEEPLEGVDTAEARFLLNGFRRYRCAKKLGIAAVPYVSLGQEEAAGWHWLCQCFPQVLALHPLSSQASRSESSVSQPSALSVFRGHYT